MDKGTNKSKLIGYFDDYSNVPTYDPPLDSPCIVCGVKMQPPRVTVSVCLTRDDYPDRSYFYRAHKACYNNLSPSDISDIDGAILGI